MSKIVELNAQEIAEVTGGKGLIGWLEEVFGEDPVDTGDYHWIGGKA